MRSARTSPASAANPKPSRPFAKNRHRPRRGSKLDMHAPFGGKARLALLGNSDMPCATLKLPRPAQ
eukprot:5900571-Pyramimonas_sp.AAC.1